MKTISDFTIHCSTEQIRQALELGAPIIADTQEIKFAKPNGLPFDVDRVVIPTAEQMIGWLETRIYNVFIDVINGSWYYEIYKDLYHIAATERDFSSRPEATLAAIDAALGYLTDKQK